MKILVINGPNINMLGIREKELYGEETYDDLVCLINNHALKKKVEVDCFQSNHEGEIVDRIQKAYKKYDGIVINAAAYTHTSIAILDALKAVGIRTVEVHITDIESREEFRKTSYVGLYAEHRVLGRGFVGYCQAIDYLVEKRLK